MRREDSEHRLNKLQKQAQAAAISTDTRDRHEMLRLLLQPPRSLCASTGHTIHTSPPRSLCSPPLPGSCDPGTISPGQHRHISGCCNVLLASDTTGSPHIPYPSLPLAWGSQSPLFSCYFKHILSERRTGALRWPTCRGGAESKDELQELCEQRRKGKFLPAAWGAAN